MKRLSSTVLALVALGVGPLSAGVVFEVETMKAIEEAGIPFGAAENPADAFTRVDGFPVVTRSFEAGELEEETTLRSARRRTLDPAEVEPPAGYKRRSMLGSP